MEPDNSNPQTLNSPQPTTLPEVQPVQPLPNPAPQNNKNRKLLIALTLVFLIAVAGAAVFFLTTKDKVQNNKAVNDIVVNYLKNDSTGKYNDFYRRNSSMYKEAAKKATFDLYDSSYGNKDIGLSGRTANTADNNWVTNLHLTFSRLSNGAFQPYQEDWDLNKFSVYIFNPSSITGHTSNCGPELPAIPTDADLTIRNNKKECTVTNHTFSGQPVYESESDSHSGPGADGNAVNFRVYTVTVGNTRIVINADKKDETIAFKILDSLKKTNADQMDFFVKDGSTPE